MRYILAAVFLVFATDVNAGMIIDQSYIPVTGEGFNTSFSGNLPLGQEFTPTLGGVDFVDLYIGDAGSDIGPGASFSINLRQGSISGAILGTSNTGFVPDNTNLGVGLYSNFIVTQFTFASMVSLNPGSTYVIEVTQHAPIVVGNFNFAAYGGPINNSTYSGGRAIVNGTPMPGFDFAFTEGLSKGSPVPEPSTFALAGLGALGALITAYRRRRSAV